MEMLETPKEFYNKVVQAVKAYLAQKLGNRGRSLGDALKKIMLQAIEATPEFQSLARYGQGDLAPEFGFIDGTRMQQGLLILLEQAIHIHVDVNAKEIITINIDQNTISSSGFGSYTSKGGAVDWLDWLLNQGSSNIVAGWHIDYNLSPDQEKRSRSGIAIMEVGGTWAVPHQFAGTSNDNFITRALNQHTMSLMRAEIKKAFKI